MNAITTYNPTTGDRLNQYPLMEKDEANAIIYKVHTTQKSWAKTTISSRTKLLLDIGRLLRKEKETFAKMITTEMGKPISQAQSEIEKCAKLCEYYAEVAADFLQAEHIKTEFYKTYRAFLPLGVIFGIMPWNFPVWQVMRFAIPNLVLGNAIIIKHAPNVMGTALLIEKFFVSAGLPENLLRSLIIDVDLAPFIIHHPKVAGVTLTGSQRAGRSVAKEAGQALKKVVLELGGSDPYIILEDADLDLAAEQCVNSRLNNAGQVCIAAKRILVVEPVYHDFIKRVTQLAQKYKSDDPSKTETLLGPMAREDLRNKVHEQVQQTIAAGAKCVFGGELPDSKGYFYPATLLIDVPFNSPAFAEEIFGPVICITKTKDSAEAFEMANNTEFGLAGAIFTRNIREGETLALNNLQAGVTAVNALVASDPRLPFGGIKQSGIGRELSIEGLREFANIKTIIVAESQS